MAQFNLTQGSTTYTPFSSTSGAVWASRFSMPTANTVMSGAVSGANDYCLITSYSVYFRTGGGAVTLGLGTGTDISDFTSSSRTASGTVTVTSDFLTAGGNTVYYGFTKSSSTTTNFSSGAETGSSIWLNGTVYVNAGTSWSGRGIYAGFTVKTLPTAPTSFAASTSTVNSATDASINLTWSAPSSNGGLAVTGYRVMYKEASSATWISLGTTTSSPYSVSGLKASTSYNFRVSAINDIINYAPGGYGDGVDDHTGPNASTTITTGAVPVVAPDGALSITAKTATSVSLAWSSTGATGRTVEVTRDGTLLSSSLTRSSGTPFVDAGLSPNTSYDYVLTVSQSGYTDFTDQQTTTTRKSAPTLTITAEATSSTSARITWTSTNAETVNITGTGITAQTDFTGSVTATGLSPSTTYRWSGTATNVDDVGTQTTGTVQSNSIQTPATVGGVWNGSAYAFPTVKAYNLGTWVTASVYVYDGTGWKKWV